MLPRKAHFAAIVLVVGAFHAHQIAKILLPHIAAVGGARRAGVRVAARTGIIAGKRHGIALGVDSLAGHGQIGQRFVHCLIQQLARRAGFIRLQPEFAGAFVGAAAVIQQIAVHGHRLRLPCLLYGVFIGYRGVKSAHLGVHDASQRLTPAHLHAGLIGAVGIVSPADPQVELHIRLGGIFRQRGHGNAVARFQHKGLLQRCVGKVLRLCDCARQRVALRGVGVRIGQGRRSTRSAQRKRRRQRQYAFPQRILFHNCSFPHAFCAHICKNQRLLLLKRVLPLLARGTAKFHGGAALRLLGIAVILDKSKLAAPPLQQK